MEEQAGGSLEVRIVPGAKNNGITPTGITASEFHHIVASAARDGHSCFLRMCMIPKVMY